MAWYRLPCRVLFLLTLLTSISACNSTGVVTRRVEPGTGAQTAEIDVDGVYLRLTQILPDQVRAFYLGRGFDPESVERIATSACVFQTVFQNKAVHGGIRFDLREWIVVHGGQTHSLRVDADWQEEWVARGVKTGPRTAFRFALLPTEHRYAVGDWNMGMTLYPLPLGSEFAMRFVWRTGRGHHAAVLDGLRCANDDAGQSK